MYVTQYTMWKPKQLKKTTQRFLLILHPLIHIFLRKGDVSRRDVILAKLKKNPHNLRSFVCRKYQAFAGHLLLHWPRNMRSQHTILLCIAWLDCLKFIWSRDFPLQFRKQRQKITCSKSQREIHAVTCIDIIKEFFYNWANMHTPESKPYSPDQTNVIANIIIPTTW